MFVSCCRALDADVVDAAVLQLSAGWKRACRTGKSRNGKEPGNGVQDTKRLLPVLSYTPAYVYTHISSAGA